jgi:hypothetical protein
MKIARMDGLSLQAQAVEARTVERVEFELDGLIEEYRERFGVVVGTDLARELHRFSTKPIAVRLGRPTVGGLRCR